MNQYFYQGEELTLFEEARNWKEYFGNKLKPYIKGNVLEVGAGIGETTPYLINDHVNEWTCLEPDTSNYSILTNKSTENKLPAKCKIIYGTHASLPAGIKYDTILYIDVLEHIEDDETEIRSAIERLNPGGHLIIMGPAYQYLYSPFDKAIGHYRRYTKKTMRNTVSFKDLSETRIFYLDITGMLFLFFNKLLLRKRYPTRSIIKVWDKFFVPVSRWLDKLFSYSLGKSIVGIWEYKQKSR